MIKSKKQMYIVIGVFALILLLGTTTYAFFNYTRTGSANTIRVGRIYFNSNQTDTINLTNLFPIDPTDSNAMNDSTKVGTFELEIEGDTDYADGIEYLVSSTNANIYTSTGKTVPITLDIDVDDLGTESSSYFTARESKNANIYKKLVGDTLVGDQMLLVGYIKPNTTSGTALGVDGTITIKAYLDENNILISDTYDGNESDNMGTPNSMAQGKTVFTTTEWNSLQANGVSFQVKVEANEGIWVTGSLEEIMKRNVVMDNVSSTYVTDVNGIDFGAVSSDINGKGVYMRAGTENDDYPIMYYRGAVEDNNVIFGDYCWKAVRTTDTGGVKLIYNGEQVNNNGTIVCNNTGSTTGIEIDNVSMFPFSGNNLYQSLAYNGYMWGSVYNWGNQTIDSTHYFGSDITYNNGEYGLVNAEEGYANSRHYTCSMANSNGTCENIKYYYYGNNYLILTNGDKIEDAIRKMQTNTVSSFAKQKIDSWYSTNMSTFTNKLEDTVWCNDRSMKTNTNGWIAGGGDITENLLYAANGRINSSNTPSLNCTNRNDAFTVKNDKGNQALTYPTALLTADEIVLAGGAYGNGTNSYLRSGVTYWTMTPSDYEDNYASNFFLGDNYLSSSGYSVSTTSYLRPAISLKPGIRVASGTGTASDPYVIE